MTIRSRPSSAAYAAGWDRIFGGGGRVPEDLRAWCRQELHRRVTGQPIEAKNYVEHGTWPDVRPMFHVKTSKKS